ncbi:hypothetical protein [Streptomyces sp. NBC_01550]|uniref:hypothetical protein n=1 Tax=Streptomyces sp. NBC_01550 TaxID=2975875 RepID=UPI00386D699F
MIDGRTVTTVSVARHVDGGDPQAGGAAGRCSSPPSSSPSRARLIDGDHELRAAAADNPYRTLTYRNELLTVGGVPAWVLTVLGAVLVTAAAALSASR